jgi:PAS domain S-box-containing protein
VVNYLPGGGEVIFDVRTQLLKNEFGRPIAMIGISTNITELVRSEDILRESRDRYQSLVANLPGVVYRCALDEEWTMFYISREMENLSGYPPEDFIYNKRRSFQSLIFEEDAERVDKTIVNAVHKKRSWNLEYRIIHREGHILWVFERGRAVMAPNGEVVFLDGFIQDITDRKHAEQEKEDYLNQLKFITDAVFAAIGVEDIDENCRIISDSIHQSNPNSYIVVSLFDPDYGSVRVRSISGLQGESKRLTELFGEDPRTITFDPSEMSKSDPPFETGRMKKVTGGLYELMAGQLSRENAAIAEKLLCIGNSYSVGLGFGEMPYGGISIFMREGFDLKYSPAIETLANHFSAVIQRKLMNEALRESEEKFRVLFYSFPLGINLTDGEGNILEANKVSENILGQSREEQKDKTIDSRQWQIIKLDGTPMPAEEFASVRALKENRIVKDVRMGIVKADKTTWISVTAAPLPIENYGVVITYMDITESVKAQEELKRISKLESLGIVAGGIAHNFKNILTSVSLSVELAKKRPERAGEMLGKIEKSIDKAAALANRFQTFYRGDEPVKNDININEVVEEAVAMGLSGSNITVVNNLDENINTVSADAKQLHEVILNMIINSRYAMAGGGIIAIRTENIELMPENIPNLNPGSYVVITISDEGSGISPEIREKIFEPFFSTKEDGHGLGLASAQMIVRKHGGAIDFRSEVGEGTSFFIYLPSKNDHEPWVSELHEQDDFSGSGGRLLLMDDEEDIREIFSDIAEEFGIEMETARDPESALEKFKNAWRQGEPYDGVILDLTIKGSSIGGEEVLGQMKEIDPEVKAFVFSGHSTKPIVANYKEYGFTGRIEKPIDINQFITEMREVFPNI